VIAQVVRWSIDHRRLVVSLVGVFALVAAVIGSRLDFDALPDLTNNQVLVLTRAPGLTPEEVERLVTRPIEAALGGVPRTVEERSLSRYGLSAITVVFEDDMPPYLARQVVQERLNSVAGSLPAGVDAPELGPLTGGLGEIFHFTLSSSQRAPSELLEIVTYRLGPLLRSVPGIVEVNTWGGDQRTFDVRADSAALAQRGLTLEDLKMALENSIGSAPGAAIPTGEGQALLRGVSRPQDATELGAALVKSSVPGARPSRVAEVAQVAQGTRPRIGAATANGHGETVYVMAQMLRGSNALDVMDNVHAKLDDIRAALPSDVRMELVYDRSVLVNLTLKTVFKNLVEGALLVVVVLFIMLGSARAGLIVASAIPLSMLGATVGMVFFGVPGNLMSLGAIDFGLLVDGAVVMVEGFVHELSLHAKAQKQELVGVLRKHAGALGRPVFFSVLVILLVYVPVLTLVGVDGKLFRPMAITVVLALATALVLSLTFIPAASTMLLRPKDVPAKLPIAVRAMTGVHDRVLRFVSPHRITVAVSSLALLLLGGWLAMRAGIEFTPQLDEGDLVIQTTREPDISLNTAVVRAGQLEAALVGKVPEVVQVVSRIGSPAVATDVMGLEQADVFVALKPREEWRKGLTREDLIAEIDAAIVKHAPGGEPSFTQPIQMRFNELIGGSVTDVGVSVYGEDLNELWKQANAIKALAESVPGAADARVLAPPNVSLIEVRPRPVDVARVGLTNREVLDAVQAIRTGVEVGATWDGPVRIPIVLRLGNATDAYSIERLGIPVESGAVLPLSAVADVRRMDAPSLIARQNNSRRLMVGFNIRGADLGTVVSQLQAKIAAEVKLQPGYRLEWSGQSETLDAAVRRLSLVVPVVLVLILATLIAAFSRLRPALVISSHVPFACVGGVVVLALRDMPISMPAAIGFIALSGVAVLNGVVLMSRLLEIEQTEPPGIAAIQAARERARPVLTTALVAALGFVPMMLAKGVGAEIQRPLATVVVGGLVTSTLLTLVILPTLYPWFAGRKKAA
jgi:cobalt-zinc-cadmium resistance protein CzcA